MYTFLNLIQKRMNYVDVYVILLVSCVLGLVVSPEEGSSLLPEGSVFFLSIFMTV